MHKTSIASPVYDPTGCQKRLTHAHAFARLAGLAAVVLIAAPSTVKSQEQVFDATCVTSERCKVRATGEVIETTKGLSLRPGDIVYWSMSNNSDKKNLGWCFLIGAKCHNNDDYRFIIKYFDKDGQRQITQIGFFNEKPAQTFAGFLNAFTGLEAGVENVKGSKRRDSAVDPASTPAFVDSTASPMAKPKGSQHLGNPAGSTPISPSGAP